MTLHYPSFDYKTETLSPETLSILKENYTVLEIDVNTEVSSNSGVIATQTHCGGIIIQSNTTAINKGGTICTPNFGINLEVGSYCISSQSLFLNIGNSKLVIVNFPDACKQSLYDYFAYNKPDISDFFEFAKRCESKAIIESSKAKIESYIRNFSSVNNNLANQFESISSLDEVYDIIVKEIHEIFNDIAFLRGTKTKGALEQIEESYVINRLKILEENFNNSVFSKLADEIYSNLSRRSTMALEVAADGFGLSTNQIAQETTIRYPAEAQFTYYGVNEYKKLLSSSYNLSFDELARIESFSSSNSLLRLRALLQMPHIENLTTNELKLLSLVIFSHGMPISKLASDNNLAGEYSVRERIGIIAQKLGATEQYSYKSLLEFINKISKELIFMFPEA